MCLKKRLYVNRREEVWSYVYTFRKRGRKMSIRGWCLRICIRLSTSSKFFFEVAAIPSVPYAASECSTDFNSCLFTFFVCFRINYRLTEWGGWMKTISIYLVHYSIRTNTYCVFYYSSEVKPPTIVVWVDMCIYVGW